MSAPTVVPTWATSVLGLSRRIDPSASAADGFDVGQRAPSQWINFLIGSLCDWADYVNERLVNARGFVVGPQEAADAGTPSATWTRDFTTSLSGPWSTASHNAVLIVQIPRLEVNDRIVGVIVNCRDFDASHTLSAELYRAQAGVDVSQSSVASSDGSGVQALALSGLSGDVIAPGDVWFLEIGCVTAGGGSRLVYSVDVIVDHP